MLKWQATQCDQVPPPPVTVVVMELVFPVAIATIQTLPLVVGMNALVLHTVVPDEQFSA